MNRVFALASAGIVVATSALAMAHADVMTTLDTDADGKLTLAEVQAVYADFTEEQFTAADTNADGSLDLDELGAAIDAGTIVTG